MKAESGERRPERDCCGADVTGGTPVPLGKALDARLSALDSRPWWVRLLSSLRISIKPGKSFKRPVSYVGVTGRVEF